MKIGIVGGGALGSALAHVFAKNCSGTWDVDEDLSTVSSLEALVKKSDVILLAVPSWANRDVAAQIASAHPTGLLGVVSLSKGIEASGATMDQVLASELGDVAAYGVIYGPMLAKGLAKGEFGCGSIATSSQKLSNALIATVKGTNLKLVPCNDIKGVAACGYLKNVYAVALGIADGLSLGFDAKSYLTQLSLYEMETLVASAGGKRQTVYEPCGVADLITTGFSGMSYNYNTGLKIGQAHPPHLLKSEGVHTIKYLNDHPAKGDLPLLNVLVDIVQHAKPVDSLRQILA